MNTSLYVGQKVLVSRAGIDHIYLMDKYIGKILTIETIYEINGFFPGRVFARMKEDHRKFAFDAQVLIPVMAKLR